MWALGPEREPFGRVASDFNCWAIYPAPYYCILQKGFIPQSQNSKNYKLRISTMKPRCLCPSGNPENLLNLGITKLISSMFSSNFIIYHLYDPAECLVLQTGKLYSIYEKKICPNSYKPAEFFFTDKNSSCNLRNFFPCILNQITLSGLFPNYEISKSLRYK